MTINFKKLICILLILFMLPLTASASDSFDVDLQGVPLKESILSLGYRAGTDIIINGDLQGSVSINVSNKTIYEILDLLAMTHNFSYQVKDNTILVSPDRVMTTIVAYHIQHTDLKKAEKQLGLMIPADKIFVNVNDNTITIDGSPAQHNKARQYLKGLDKPIQQILVKAAFIEINRDKGIDSGLDFALGTYTGGPLKNLEYIITPNIQDTKGIGRMLARPSVITANGEEAKILMGDKVPVFTSTNTSGSSGDSVGSNTVEYKDVGVTLKVTPRINDLEKGIVTLSLSPEVSTIAKWITSNNNTAPQIATRTLTNQVRLKSGETLIIGGLFREEEIENIVAIPFLSKLPVLGNLFKHIKNDKRKTEIAIAITPEIIEDIDGIPNIYNSNIQAQTPKDPYINEEYLKIKTEVENFKKDLETSNTIINELKNQIKANESTQAELLKQNEQKLQNILSNKTEEVTLLKEQEQALKKEKQDLEKVLSDYIEKDYESLKNS